MQTARTGNAHVLLFRSGETESNILNLSQGVTGAFIVPPGSPAIGRTIQFVEVGPDYMDFPETNLLSTPKTLVAGHNPLTAAELERVSMATRCRFVLGSAAPSDLTIHLLWKS